MNAPANSGPSNFINTSTHLFTGVGNHLVNASFSEGGKNALANAILNTNFSFGPNGIDINVTKHGLLSNITPDGELAVNVRNSKHLEDEGVCLAEKVSKVLKDLETYFKDASKKKNVEALEGFRTRTAQAFQAVQQQDTNSLAQGFNSNAASSFNGVVDIWKTHMNNVVWNKSDRKLLAGLQESLGNINSFSNKNKEFATWISEDYTIEFLIQRELAFESKFVKELAYLLLEPTDEIALEPQQNLTDKQKRVLTPLTELVADKQTSVVHNSATLYDDFERTIFSGKDILDRVHYFKPSDSFGITATVLPNSLHIVETLKLRARKLELYEGELGKANILLLSLGSNNERAMFRGHIEKFMHLNVDCSNADLVDAYDKANAHLSAVIENSAVMLEVAAKTIITNDMKFGKGVYPLEAFTDAIKSSQTLKKWTDSVYQMSLKLSLSKTDIIAARQFSVPEVDLTYTLKAYTESFNDDINGYDLLQDVLSEACIHKYGKNHLSPTQIEEVVRIFLPENIKDALDAGDTLEDALMENLYSTVKSRKPSHSYVLQERRAMSRETNKKLSMSPLHREQEMAHLRILIHASVIRGAKPIKSGVHDIVRLITAGIDDEVTLPPSWTVLQLMMNKHVEKQRADSDDIMQIIEVRYEKDMAKIIQKNTPLSDLCLQSVEDIYNRQDFQIKKENVAEYFTESRDVVTQVAEYVDKNLRQFVAYIAAQSHSTGTDMRDSEWQAKKIFEVENIANACNALQTKLARTIQKLFIAGVAGNTKGHLLDFSVLNSGELIESCINKADPVYMEFTEFANPPGDSFFNGPKTNQKCKDLSRSVFGLDKSFKLRQQIGLETVLMRVNDFYRNARIHFDARKRSYVVQIDTVAQYSASAHTPENLELVNMLVEKSKLSPEAVDSEQKLSKFVFENLLSDTNGLQSILADLTALPVPISHSALLDEDLRLDILKVKLFQYAHFVNDKELIIASSDKSLNDVTKAHFGHKTVSYEILLKGVLLNDFIEQKSLYDPGTKSLDDNAEYVVKSWKKGTVIEDLTFSKVPFFALMEKYASLSPEYSPQNLAMIFVTTKQKLFSDPKELNGGSSGEWQSISYFHAREEDSSAVCRLLGTSAMGSWVDCQADFKLVRTYTQTKSHMKLHDSVNNAFALYWWQHMSQYVVDYYNKLSRSTTKPNNSLLQMPLALVTSSVGPVGKSDAGEAALMFDTRRPLAAAQETSGERQGAVSLTFDTPHTLAVVGKTSGEYQGAVTLTFETPHTLAVVGKTSGERQDVAIDELTDNTLDVDREITLIVREALQEFTGDNSVFDKIKNSEMAQDTKENMIVSMLLAKNGTGTRELQEKLNFLGRKVFGLGEFEKITKEGNNDHPPPPEKYTEAYSHYLGKPSLAQIDATPNTAISKGIDDSVQFTYTLSPNNPPLIDDTESRETKLNTSESTAVTHRSIMSAGQDASQNALPITDDLRGQIIPQESRSILSDTIPHASSTSESNVVTPQGTVSEVPGTSQNLSTESRSAPPASISETPVNGGSTAVSLQGTMDAVKNIGQIPVQGYPIVSTDTFLQKIKTSGMTFYNIFQKNDVNVKGQLQATQVQVKTQYSGIVSIPFSAQQEIYMEYLSLITGKGPPDFLPLYIQDEIRRRQHEITNGASNTVYNDLVKESGFEAQCGTLGAWITVLQNPLNIMSRDEDSQAWARWCNKEMVEWNDDLLKKIQELPNKLMAMATKENKFRIFTGIALAYGLFNVVKLTVKANPAIFGMLMIFSDILNLYIVGYEDIGLHTVFCFGVLLYRFRARIAWLYNLFNRHKIKENITFLQTCYSHPRTVPISASAREDLDGMPVYRRSLWAACCSYLSEINVVRETVRKDLIMQQNIREIKKKLSLKGHVCKYNNKIRDIIQAWGQFDVRDLDICSSTVEMIKGLLELMDDETMETEVSSAAGFGSKKELVAALDLTKLLQRIEMLPPQTLSQNAQSISNEFVEIYKNVEEVCPKIYQIILTLLNFETKKSSDGVDFSRALKRKTAAMIDACLLPLQYRVLFAASIAKNEILASEARTDYSTSELPAAPDTITPGLSTPGTLLHEVASDVNPGKADDPANAGETEAGVQDAYDLEKKEKAEAEAEAESQKAGKQITAEPAAEVETKAGAEGGANVQALWILCCEYLSEIRAANLLPEEDFSVNLGTISKLLLSESPTSSEITHESPLPTLQDLRGMKVCNFSRLHDAYENVHNLLKRMPIFDSSKIYMKIGNINSSDGVLQIFICNGILNVAQNMFLAGCSFPLHVTANSYMNEIKELWKHLLEFMDNTSNCNSKLKIQISETATVLSRVGLGNALPLDRVDVNIMIVCIINVNIHLMTAHNTRLQKVGLKVPVETPQESAMRGIVDDDFRQRLLYASMSDSRRPVYLRIALMMRNSIESDISQWMNFDPTGTTNAATDELFNTLTDIGVVMPAPTADDMNTGMSPPIDSSKHMDLQHYLISVETERFRIANNIKSLDERLSDHNGGNPGKSSVSAEYFKLPSEYPDLSSPQTTLEIVRKLCLCMEMKSANEAQRNLSCLKTLRILQKAAPE